MKCICSILFISWRDKVCHQQQRFYNGRHSIIDRKWLGHLCHKDDSQIPKDILYRELQMGSRAVGSTKATFQRCVWYSRDWYTSWQLGVPIWRLKQMEDCLQTATWNWWDQAECWLDAAREKRKVATRAVPSVTYTCEVCSASQRLDLSVTRESARIFTKS